MHDPIRYIDAVYEDLSKNRKSSKMRVTRAIKLLLGMVTTMIATLALHTVHNSKVPKPIEMNYQRDLRISQIALDASTVAIPKRNATFPLVAITPGASKKQYAIPDGGMLLSVVFLTLFYMFHWLVYEFKKYRITLQEGINSAAVESSITHSLLRNVVEESSMNSSLQSVLQAAIDDTRMILNSERVQVNRNEKQRRMEQFLKNATTLYRTPSRMREAWKKASEKGRNRVRKNLAAL
jgi:hypothetical protein